MNEIEIPFSELNITLADIYEALGYKGNVPELEIVLQTQELMKVASVRVKPSYYYRNIFGQLVLNKIDIEDVCLNVGGTIARLLKNSSQYACFVATAGHEFELWNAEIRKKNEWIEIFIVDSIGTCIAEKAGDFLELQLEKEIGNLKHTNRFSPGYCDWHLIEQVKLFSLLPLRVCSITITESSLMYPIKSISGIIGIGESVKEKVYSCNVCKKKDCFRRKPMNQLKVILK